jgi:hypothetical protein
MSIDNLIAEIARKQPTFREYATAISDAVEKMQATLLEAGFGLGVTVSNKDGVSVEWKRTSGSWQLVYSKGDDSWPLTQCKIGEKCAGLALLPALIEKLHAEQKRLLKEMSEVIQLPPKCAEANQ